MSYEYRDCCNPCCDYGESQSSYEPKPVGECCGTTGIYEALVALQQSIKEFNIPGFGVSVIITTVTGQSYTVVFAQGIKNPPKVRPGTLTYGDLVISLCDVAKIQIQVSQNSNPRFRQLLSRRLKEVTTQFCNWDNYGYEENCNDEDCGECVREMQCAISRNQDSISAVSYNGSQDQIGEVPTISGVNYTNVVGNVNLVTQASPFLNGVGVTGETVAVVKDVIANVVSAISTVSVVSNTVLTGVTPTTIVVSEFVDTRPTTVIGNVTVTAPETGIVIGNIPSVVSALSSITTVPAIAVGSIGSTPVTLVGSVSSIPVAVLGDITHTIANVIGNVETSVVAMVRDVTTVPVATVQDVTTVPVGVVGSLETVPQTVLQSFTTVPSSVVGNVTTVPETVVTAIHPTTVGGALTGISAFTVTQLPVITIPQVIATQTGEMYILVPQNAFGTHATLTFTVQTGPTISGTTVALGAPISLAGLGQPATIVNMTGLADAVTTSAVVTGFADPTTIAVVGSVITVAEVVVKDVEPTTIPVVGAVTTTPVAVVGSVGTVAGIAIGNVTVGVGAVVGDITTIPAAVVSEISKVPAIAVASVETIPAVALAAVTTTPVGVVGAVDTTPVTVINAINNVTVAGGLVTSVIPQVINNVTAVPSTVVVLNGITPATTSIGSVVAASTVAFNAVTAVTTTPVISQVILTPTTLPALTAAVVTTVAKNVVNAIQTTSVPVLSPVMETIEGNVDTIGNGVFVVDNTNGDLTIYSICEVTSLNG